MVKYINGLLVLALITFSLPHSAAYAQISQPSSGTLQVTSQPLISIVGPPRVEMYIFAGADPQYVLEVKGASDYQQLRVDVFVAPALDSDGNEFPGTLNPERFNLTLQIAGGLAFERFQVHIESRLGNGGIYATNITAVAYLLFGEAQSTKPVQIFLTHAVIGIGIVAAGSVISFLVKRPKRSMRHVGLFIVALVLALSVALQFINSNPQFGRNIVVDYISAFVFGFTARVDLVVSRREGKKG